MDLRVRRRDRGQDILHEEKKKKERHPFVVSSIQFQVRRSSGSMRFDDRWNRTFGTFLQRSFFVLFDFELEQKMRRKDRWNACRIPSVRFVNDVFHFLKKKRVSFPKTKSTNRIHKKQKQNEEEPLRRRVRTIGSKKRKKKKERDPCARSCARSFFFCFVFVSLVSSFVRSIHLVFCFYLYFIVCLSLSVCLSLKVSLSVCLSLFLSLPKAWTPVPKRRKKKNHFWVWIVPWIRCQRPSFFYIYSCSRSHPDVRNQRRRSWISNILSNGGRRKNHTS